MGEQDYSLFSVRINANATVLQIEGCSSLAP
ncbi:hypothetical protein PM8797T_31413 [Gimesia maris DSM 8797]|nr:hypothetical protein PM8797T_31413 [Gimesia maris DSM 8797]